MRTKDSQNAAPQSSRSPVLDHEILSLDNPVLACEPPPSPAPERACEPLDLDTWQWADDGHSGEELNALDFAPLVQNPPDPERLAAAERILAMTDAELAALVAVHAPQVEPPAERDAELDGNEGGASYDPGSDWTAKRQRRMPKEADAARKARRQAELRALLDDPPALTARYYKLANKAKKCDGAQRETLLELVKEVAHYRELAYARRDEAARMARSTAKTPVEPQLAFWSSTAVGDAPRRQGSPLHRRGVQRPKVLYRGNRPTGTGDTAITRRHIQQPARQYPPLSRGARPA